MSIFKDVSSTQEDRNYPYHKFIKSPSDLGASSKGNLTALGNDIGALQSYVGVLVSGNTKAHVGRIGPLGNKYFMNTGATCDASDGSTQPRYIFVNNIPDGEIPLLSSAMGQNMTQFEGLVPGVLESISYINPLKLFTAFSQTTDCQQITMETRDINNAVSTDSKYVLNDDISSYNSCWFPDKKNPVTQEKCKEGMTVKKKEVQLYMIGIGCLGIYILQRLLHKRS
jgi:hypothetical protein